MKTPIALTIAGSDSGGGAGIQADLKAFSALRVYGCSVITALTAQNTRGVTGIHTVPADFVRAQMEAVFDDLAIDAVKVGMLGTADVIEAVATGLERWRPPWVVIDTVMVAKGGDRLLDPGAVDALRSRLLPLATIITPNLPEAADLLGEEQPKDREGMRRAADRLRALGPAHVLIKGGHLEGDESPDLLVSDGRARWFEAQRTNTANTHGTGCTLSASIAAGLARGLTVTDAVSEAKRYVEGAIRAADRIRIGHGHGPVHHFYRDWSKAE